MRKTRPRLDELEPAPRRVAAGLRHALAVAPDGHMWACGKPGPCGLDRAPEAGAELPGGWRLALRLPVVFVACGADHSVCKVLGGGLLGAGRAADGQLPVAPDAPAGTWRALDARLASASCCALGADHSLFLVGAKVWACGRTAEGQRLSASGPELAVLPLPPARLIASGADHAAMLDDGGQVLRWGGDEDLDQPRLPPCGLVAAGGLATACVSVLGRVFVQGKVKGVKLGSFRVVPDLPAVLSVSCGFDALVALTKQGVFDLCPPKREKNADEPWRDLRKRPRLRPVAAAAEQAACLGERVVLWRPRGPAVLEEEQEHARAWRDLEDSDVDESDAEPGTDEGGLRAALGRAGGGAWR